MVLVQFTEANMRGSNTEHEQESNSELIEIGAATELTQGPPGKEAEEVILLEREP